MFYNAFVSVQKEEKIFSGFCKRSDACLIVALVQSGHDVSFHFWAKVSSQNVDCDEKNIFVLMP
jgi:hypothetical protein